MAKKDLFVGRTELLRLIDRMVEPGGSERNPTTGRALVVEGCGGSGRTALLRTVQRNWEFKTPVVRITPGCESADEATRPLLTAIQVGLSGGAPGYPLSFERLLLAQIAIRAGLSPGDPTGSLALLRTQTDVHRDRAVLSRLVKELLAETKDLRRSSCDADVTGDTEREVVDQVIGLLDRPFLSRRTRWSEDALAWFGHQDQDLHLNAEQARLQLGFQAHRQDHHNRCAVDDLLVAALLADLRDSLARVRRPAADVVVLVDDGDSPRATAFFSALLRVRQALADSGSSPRRNGSDRLATVVTSSGALVVEMTEDVAAPALLEEPPGLEPDSGLWTRVRLPGLSPKQVNRLADDILSPSNIGTASIGHAVHRLTHGHPGAAKLVLEELDFGLGKRAGEKEQGLSCLAELADRLLFPLLELFLHEVPPWNGQQVEALITLSAARNVGEAQVLVPLLPYPFDLNSALHSSPALWNRDAAVDATGYEELHPLVRYLGLRALSQRGAGHEAAWEVVLRTLREHADDQAGRLRHTLLLGEPGARDAVAGELVEALKEMPTTDWLALFDTVAAELNPRGEEPKPISAALVSATTFAQQLLGVVPLIEHNPGGSGAQWAETYCVHAALGFRYLVPYAQDPVPLIRRAQHYESRSRKRG
ncbi:MULTISPECIES: hypothetical protein [Actinosynnema]|uniref:hypothetical protein n=1 Tax=Actinosynnema TaxID=40566 RepID=UPI0020A52658|nr:hypothetical protein [Actinosynnema pretiosum]MCP2096709.1 hypothetical protein [Actinosynnema pretiosum]